MRFPAVEKFASVNWIHLTKHINEVENLVNYSGRKEHCRIFTEGMMNLFV